MKNKKKDDKPVRRTIALGDTALTFTSTIETLQITKHIGCNVHGLVPEPGEKPSLEEFGQVLKKCAVWERGIQFMIGDAFNLAKHYHGEDASQLMDATEWSIKTVGIYMWIAERITPDRRRMDRLGIAHHMLVAERTPKEQTKWLTKAAADDEEKPWTVARLREAMKHAKGESDPTAWFVVVACPNGQVQDQLMQRLEAEGLTCKATVSHAAKALPAVPLASDATENVA